MVLSFGTFTSDSDSDSDRLLVVEVRRSNPDRPKQTQATGVLSQKFYYFFLT